MSTSIKFRFESIIKSNVVFVANSISISISNIEKFETNEIVVVIQKIIKQKIAIVVVIVIETIKFETCVKNINYFDFIMQINFWKKFRISINIANFLHHLIDVFVKYRKKNILKILFQCFRDFVLKWLKIKKFISLNDFKTIIIKTFSFASFDFAINFD